MKLSIVLSVVFVLHMQWVCADSDTTTILPVTAEKIVTETNAPIVVISSDDKKNITVQPSVAMNKLLQQNKKAENGKQEQPPTTEVGL